MSPRTRLSESGVGHWLLLVVAALLVLGLQAPFGKDLLARAGLVPSTTPFLELSFSDPGDHPQRVTPGETVPVSFLITGNSGTFAEVEWRIDTIDASGIQPAASGTETVPEGESRIVMRDVPVSCAGATVTQPRTEVRVSVVAPALQILFWVACDPGDS